ERAQLVVDIMHSLLPLPLRILARTRDDSLNLLYADILVLLQIGAKIGKHVRSLEERQCRVDGNAAVRVRIIDQYLPFAWSHPLVDRSKYLALISRDALIVLPDVHPRGADSPRLRQRHPAACQQLVGFLELSFVIRLQIDAE